jgi:dihydrolipoamide dehydrogenase
MSAWEKRRSSWSAAWSKLARHRRRPSPAFYAIGDIVAGLPQLAHVGRNGWHGGRRQKAGKKFRSINRNRIPSCTYSDPQIGSVGLTEAQAKEKGHDVKVGKFPLCGQLEGDHRGQP